MSTNLPGKIFVVQLCALACLARLLAAYSPATAFSRAFNLSFSLCLFNSNSTLKNPVQYKPIDKTEKKNCKGRETFLLSGHFGRFQQYSLSRQSLLNTASAHYLIV